MEVGVKSAFDLGAEAFSDGKNLIHNPFDSDFEHLRYMGWRDGFQQAEKEELADQDRGEEKA